MASKIDFNILLAQADKNTNKAHKLLAEKKQLNQKSTKSTNPNKNESSKQSALAFIQQKKEEIRKRNEKEARELLERKKEKDAINNPAPKKPAPNKQKVVSNDAVQKYLNSKKNINNKSQPNSTPALPNKKPSSHVASNNTRKPNNTGQANKAPPPIQKYDHTKSYYDQIPTVKINEPSTKPNKPKQPIQNTRPSIQTKPSFSSKSSGSKPIPKKKVPIASTKSSMSYDQILKMAENCHKDKSSNPTKSEVSESTKANDYRDLYFNNYGKNQKASSSVATLAAVKKFSEERKRPEESRPQLKKPQEQSRGALAKAPVSAPAKSTPGMSSWDKIVSDMKRKPVKKIKNKEPEYNQIDCDEEEDEYDSEMDDFLDDESDEEDTRKSSYSKEIQEIFKYDPKRYKHINLDDCDNMETNFHNQLKEEKASLRLGIQEDIMEMKIEAELERKKLNKKRQMDQAKENPKKIKS